MIEYWLLLEVRFVGSLLYGIRIKNIYGLRIVYMVKYRLC